MRTATLLLLCAVAVWAQGDPLVRGLEAFQKGDLPAAERELRLAAKSGGDPRAGAFLAITLASTGRCAEAGPGLGQAVQSGTADVARLAGLALAQCHLAAGRVEDASAVLAKLRARDPSDADALFLTARLYMRAWNDTIYQLYQKNPSSFRVNQLSAEILEMQGQFKEAVAEYRKAISKNPQALNLHFRLGRALLMVSNAPEALEEARKEFETELRLNPGDPVASYQVAQILLLEEKRDEAAAQLVKSLELRKDFPEALIALGKIRLEEKKNGEAVALLENAVRLMPASEAAHYSLMMAYRNAGRMEDARRQKVELDKLQKAPEGEFTEFLKKLGEKPPEK
jgi:tetratricopeptide (TPR) repeat protein